ncbi:MAG: 2-iminoacetate synthase ThiH [Acidimicrobiales bacterium]
MTAVPVELEAGPGADGVPAGTAAADLLSFLDRDLARLVDRSTGASAADVARALAPGRRLDMDDLAALLSPTAADCLEALAAASHRLTVARFGRAVRLFAPLYLSNECASTCTYCGFSAGNDIARRTLSPEEAAVEARALAGSGFRHVLLVSGEHARIVSRDYLADCVAAVAAEVPSVAVEVQVWEAEAYRRLVAAGCEGLVVYQESYDRSTYAATHLRGRKRNYEWRLAAPDRGAAAGMRQLGVGALLGLHDDWRADVLAVAAHARALVRRWWRCSVSVSVPRLRPAAGGFVAARPVGDRELAQAVCALRLVLPDVGVSLSTREPPALRDGLVRLGVTTMSAGSHTEPGGYAAPTDAEPQFEVGDTRSPAEVAAVLAAAGYDPVWRDTIGARRPPVGG